MRFHLFFALASILHLPWSFVHQDLMDSTDPESWLLPSAPLLPNLLLHISLATYKRASRPVHPGTAFNAHTHTRGHQIRNWIYPAGGKCKKSIETLPPHFFFSSSNQMTGHLIFRPQSGRQRVQSSTASLGSIDHQTFEYESQSRSAARKKKKKRNVSLICNFLELKRGRHIQVKRRIFKYKSHKLFQPQSSGKLTLAETFLH